jgi:hypothetical protein
MLDIIKNKLGNLDINPGQIQTLLDKLQDFKDLESAKNILFETLNSFGISSEVIENTFGDLLNKADSLGEIKAISEDPIGKVFEFLQDIFEK